MIRASHPELSHPRTQTLPWTVAASPTTTCETRVRRNDSIHCSFIIRARSHSSWFGYVHAQPPAVWRWRSVDTQLDALELGTLKYVAL
jgi:hypothetical protein